MDQATVENIKVKIEEAAQYLTAEQKAFLLGYGEGVCDSMKKEAQEG